MKGTALILVSALALVLGGNKEDVEVNAAGCPLDPEIHWILPHEEYCNKFYSCVGGKPIALICPASLVFNSEEQVCDWAVNVDCGNKGIYEVSAPEPESEEEEEQNHGGNSDPSAAPEICARENSDGVLVAHENCNQFYKCDKKVPVVLDCQPGLLYNYNNGWCDWPYNVECGDRVIPSAK